MSTPPNSQDSDWVELLQMIWAFLLFWEMFVHCVRSLWERERCWTKLVPLLPSRDLTSCVSEVMKHEFKRSDFIQVIMAAKRETSCLKLYLFIAVSMQTVYIPEIKTTTTKILCCHEGYQQLLQLKMHQMQFTCIHCQV